MNAALSSLVADKNGLTEREFTATVCENVVACDRETKAEKAAVVFRVWLDRAFLSRSVKKRFCVARV